MENSIEIGNLVKFIDEFGNEQVSIVIGTDVMPECNTDLLAIDGSYGCYLRFKNEVEKVEEKHGNE